MSKYYFVYVKIKSAIEGELDYYRIKPVVASVTAASSDRGR